MITVVGVVAIVLLILVIISKTMDLLVGLLGLIGGVFAYFWLGTPDSWMTQLKIAFEFGVNPADLKTYSLIIAGVGLIVLIMGLVRGKKQPKVIVVQQQVPVTPEKEKNVEPKNEQKQEEKIEKIEEKKEEENKPK